MGNPEKELADYDLDMFDERLGLDELLNTVMPKYRSFWKEFVCRRAFTQDDDTSERLKTDCRSVGNPAVESENCSKELQSALCGNGGTCRKIPAIAGSPGASMFFCKCHKGYANSSPNASPMCDLRIDYEADIALRKAAISGNPASSPASLGSPVLTAGLIAGFVILFFLLIGCVWIVFIKKYNKVFPSPMFSFRGTSTSPLSASKYSLSPASTPGHDYRLNNTSSHSRRTDSYYHSPYGASSMAHITLGCIPQAPMAAASGIDSSFSPGGFGLKQRSPAISGGSNSSTPRIKVHRNNSYNNRSRSHDDSGHRTRSFRFPSIKEDEEEPQLLLANQRQSRPSRSYQFEQYLDYVVTEEESVPTPLLEACIGSRANVDRDVEFWEMTAPGASSAFSALNSPNKEHDA